MPTQSSQARIRPKPLDFAAAAIIGVVVVGGLCAAPLLPFGKSLLLVRLATDGKDPAATIAARAGAELVNIPAPGYAVIFGDAATARAAFGVAVAWRGLALCAART